MIRDLGAQVEKIYTNVVEIVYFMRGAISLNDIMETTTVEKTLISDWLSKRLEKEFQRHNPVY